MNLLNIFQPLPAVRQAFLKVLIPIMLIILPVGIGYATELMPPLEINLTVLDPDPSLGSHSTVKLDFMIKKYEYGRFIPSQVTTRKVDVSLYSKNLEISGQKNFVFNNIAREEKKEIEIPIFIRTTGEAQLIAGIDVFDESGKRVFGGSDALYFLVFADRVFTGKSSLNALHFKKLKEDRQKGLITEEEFKEKVEALSRGKAGGTTRRIK
jgi:hypothetical protein